MTLGGYNLLTIGDHLAGQGHIQGPLQPGFPGFGNKDGVDLLGRSGQIH